jgi:hypothetical protein
VALGGGDVAVGVGGAVMNKVRRDYKNWGVMAAVRLALVRVIELIMPYRFCHASLIVWALGYCKWSEVCEEHGHTCRKDSDSDRLKDSGCYCGYYWNGKLNRK